MGRSGTSPPGFPGLARRASPRPALSARSPRGSGFYVQWDRGWRVGPFADVVVRFDTLPIHLVFWRGTSYIPNWVTENGIWYNNQSTETWTGVRGCGEPMSDKQCRYSNVHVIESTDARAVVHWRYALGDVFYTIARPDPDTGLGDGPTRSTRSIPTARPFAITLHSTQPEEPHEWQESIIVMGPGFRPETVLDPDGLTMINAAGGARPTGGKRRRPPAEARQARRGVHPAHPHQEPFPAVRHGPAAGQAHVRHLCWRGAQGCEHVSLVESLAGGGLRVRRPLRPGRRPPKSYLAGAPEVERLSSRPPIDDQDHAHGSERSTRGEAAGDAPRAWSRPAPIEITSPGYTTSGFDPTEKAYQIQRLTNTEAPLSLKLRATAESPLVNPVFVIQNWGEGAADLAVNETSLHTGRQFRQGVRRGLLESDLIVWVRHEGTRPVTVEIQHAGQFRRRSHLDPGDRGRQAGEPPRLGRGLDPAHGTCFASRRAGFLGFSLSGGRPGRSEENFSERPGRPPLHRKD